MLDYRISACSAITGFRDKGKRDSWSILGKGRCIGGHVGGYNRTYIVRIKDKKS